ncbi:MAG: putative exported protein [Deltaproteobacteria bacterium]|nr:putative exported protein [Deltaproteobacteria bacterium]
MKLKFISMALLVGMVFLWAQAGLCQNNLHESEWAGKTGKGQVDWTAGYITAVGVGVAPDKSVGIVEARPAAFRAARAEACRNLLETAMGVQVDSTTTIKDLAGESDIIHTQLEGLIQGSQVADQEYRSDDTAQVTLKIPLYGNLSQVMIPQVMKQKKSGQPFGAASAVEKASCIGLVIDARGVGARPALLPGIRDENGGEISEAFRAELETSVMQGLCGYTRSQHTANGLMNVKALKADGPGKSNLIISNADAEKIRTASEKKSFMNNCRVVIVLD